MDTALEKKRLDKLARVRENQRKSRARRLDHVRDLEQKVLGLQQELDRRDVEHRLAVQRLEAENQKLRGLQLSSGVPPEALEAYLRSVDNPVTAQKIAIPAIQRLPVETHLRAENAKCSRPCSSVRDPGVEEPEPSDYPTGTSKENTDPNFEPQHEEATEPHTPELPPLCACPGDNQESLPINERVLNTTFCAIAEKLVDQYNSRCVDVSEIKQKLRQGFFRSSSEDGCRVQNQILFQVLDEISGH
ncbi:hypothetical protein BDW62DRAFT_592, partial [Aspergillus aurantiobrunneus]